MENNNGVSPLISVIIPFFNVGDYIEECLRSVTGQTYQNLEILLVDDCSQDNSRQIAEMFARDDPRITLLTHNENQGLGPARNTGIRYANGEYLFFLDSDDMLKLDAFNILLDKSISEKVEVVIGSSEGINKNGEFIDHDRQWTTNSSFGKISGEEAYIRSCGWQRKPYLPNRACGPLFKKDLFIRSGLEFPALEFEDMGTIPFIFIASNEVMYIPDIIYTYRVRESSITHKLFNSQRIERYWKLCELMVSHLSDIGMNHQIGNTSLVMIRHLIYWINRNGYEIECIDNMGKFVNHAGSFIENSPYSEQLLLDTLEDLLNFYLQNSQITKDQFINFISSSYIEVLHSFEKKLSSINEDKRKIEADIFLLQSTLSELTHLHERLTSNLREIYIRFD